MKFYLTFLVATFGFSTAQAANDFQLKTLSCTASNGVQIQTVKQFEKENGQEVLEVMTTFAGAKKNFIASMPVVSFDSATGIILTPVSNGPTYLVNLNLNPKISQIQKVTGSLQMLVNRYQAMTLASVVCKIQVTEE